MNKKIVLSLMLILSLFMGTIASAAAPQSVQVAQEYQGNPFEKKEFTGTFEVEKQIEKLIDLGLVSEAEAEDVVQDYQPEILHHYSEVNIMDKGAYLVALDTANNKTINPEQLIEEKENSQLQRGSSTQQAKSLAFYIVHFFFFIGNPATTNADLVHTGTVTGCFGFGCPDDYTAVLRLKASATRGGYVYDTITETSTVDLLEDAELVEPITETAYWYWDSIIYANESGGQVPADSGQGDTVLINKRGMDYPLDYTDPQSGIALYEPPTILTVNTIPRDNAFRTNFMTYYTSNWGSPTEFDWNEVEIHHNRPLKYGGSNAMSNAIPLMNPSSSHPVIPQHTYLTTWWASY